MNHILDFKLSPVLSLYCFERQIIAFYHHYIYEFDTTEYNLNLDRLLYINKLSVERISLDNLYFCENKDFSVKRMREYLFKQSNKVQGFCFFLENKPIGFIWLMFKNGDEFQYKVRNVESLIFDVEILENYSGYGYGAILMKYVLSYLNFSGVKFVRLAVRNNNINAIKLYERLNGYKVDRKYFLQFFRRYNVPYHEV